MDNRATLVCTALAVVGVPVTAVLASRAGRKTADINTDGMTKWEAFKKKAPYYIPTAMAGSMTVTAIALSAKFANVATRDKLVAYASSVAALDSHVGKELPKLEPPKQAADIHQWHEPITDQWFSATPYDVRSAAYELNHIMIRNGTATLADFCRLLQIKPTIQSELLGWSDISAIEYEYDWIDVEWRQKYDATGNLYFEMYYPHPPHDDYKDPGGKIAEQVARRYLKGDK